MTRPVPPPEVLDEYRHLLEDLQRERDAAAERLLTAEINLRAVARALSLATSPDRAS